MFTQGSSPSRPPLAANNAVADQIVLRGPWRISSSTSGPRSVGVVCQVGLTDLGGGSPLSCRPLRPTKTMAAAPFPSIPRNTRFPGQATASTPSAGRASWS